MDAFLAERGELHNNHTVTMMRTPYYPTTNQTMTRTWTRAMTMTDNKDNNDDHEDLDF